MTTTPPPNTPVVTELLGPMVMHLGRAQSAYRAYLSGGKTYRRACVLWECNSALRGLLLAKGYLLPEALQPQAQLIVAHIDYWAVLWVAHRDALKPAGEDVFAFENPETFPAEAEQQLVAYYRSLVEPGA